MDQKKQISPYYLFYLKGVKNANTKSVFTLKLAADYLEKALTFKETQEAFKELAVVYTKLDDNDSYKKTILRGAEAGFKLFYSSCGLYYANNKEEANEQLSLEWFNKGLEINDSKTISDLANLYMTGCNAFDKDYDKAGRLLQKGLDTSNDNKWKGYFAWSLGQLSYEKKLYSVAASLYQQAIDLGYVQASRNLAVMYRDGVGVKKDSEKYVECLMLYLCPENAAEIAGVFLLNQLTPPDEEIAFDYLQYAANKGHAVAAMVCAGILINRKSTNEQLINRYLELAFKNGINNDNLKDCFEEIEDAFGEVVGKKLKSLAEEYWNIRRGEA